MTMRAEFTTSHHPFQHFRSSTEEEEEEEEEVDVYV